jgi:hypothetical protein
MNMPDYRQSRWQNQVNQLRQIPRQAAELLAQYRTFRAAAQARWDLPPAQKEQGIKQAQAEVARRLSEMRAAAVQLRRELEAELAPIINRSPSLGTAELAHIEGLRAWLRAVKNPYAEARRILDESRADGPRLRALYVALDDVLGERGLPQDDQLTVELFTLSADQEQLTAFAIFQQVRAGGQRLDVGFIQADEALLRDTMSAVIPAFDADAEPHIVGPAPAPAAAPAPAPGAGPA